MSPAVENTEPLWSIASLKGSDELAIWIDELARRAGLPKRVDVILRALQTLAVAHGYKESMPER